MEYQPIRNKYYISTNQEPAKPMVYAGVYPFNQSETRELKAAIERLTLNDRSVSVIMVSINQSEASIILCQPIRRLV